MRSSFNDTFTGKETWGKFINVCNNELNTHIHGLLVLRSLLFVQSVHLLLHLKGKVGITDDLLLWFLQRSPQRWLKASYRAIFRHILWVSDIYKYLCVLLKIPNRSCILEIPHIPLFQPCSKTASSGSLVWKERRGS